MTNLLVKLFIKDRDNVLDNAVRQRYGVLAGVAGIVLNLLLSGGKLLAGYLSGSISITADGFNNLSDAGSSAVTLAGFRIAGKEADSGHPFGHGRIEYLTGLGVAVIILMVGVELGKSSFQQILSPQPVSFSWLTAGILALSIGVKLWMCLFNRSLSRRIHSPAMAATAADSLSDVAATSAVLLGTLAGHFLGLSIDGWVGMLVALFILKSGWDAAKDTLNPLLGQGPDPELVRSIESTVLAYPDITGVHDLVVHDYGPGRRMASLHAEVPSSGDLMALHDIVDAAERELKAKFRLQATIHMDPIATDDAQINATRDAVAALVKEINSGMSIHDFRMTNGPHHRNLIFDVAVPFHVKHPDDEIKARIARAVRELDPSYFSVIEIDRPLSE